LIQRKKEKIITTITVNSIKAYQQQFGEENLQVKGGNIFWLDTLGDFYMN
jgi:hypothetical protein